MDSDRNLCWLCLLICASTSAMIGALVGSQINKTCALLGAGAGAVLGVFVYGLIRVVK